MSTQQTSKVAVDAPILVDLEKKNPQLRILTVSSENFRELSALYIKSNTSTPLAIVRPRTEEEVRKTIAFTSLRSIPLAVRVGGHDFLRRSGPDKAVVLDLRDLNAVTVTDDGEAAIIGGGILAQDLVDNLAKTGHATTVGFAPSVGWAGWAMHGGYGPFAGLFGLGADQILGARIINHEGQVVEADEKLLYGIRGAGSAFGVVVSLKIKIHKLEKVLGGALIFSLDPLASNLDRILTNYQDFLDQGIPNELGLDVGVVNLPNVGKAFFCSFVWASEDVPTGKAALARVSKIGPIAMDTVSELSPAAWLQSQVHILPPYGVYAEAGPASVMVPSFNEQVREVLVKYSKELPENPATMWVEHHVHGAALEPRAESSFAYRQSHIMIEILGSSTQEDSAKGSGDWAVAFQKAARSLHDTFDGGYVVLTSSDIPPRRCYPGHWDRLQKLKSSVDPDNKFSFSVTGLNGKW